MERGVYEHHRVLMRNERQSYQALLEVLTPPSLRRLQHPQVRHRAERQLGAA